MARLPITRARPYTPSAGRFAGRTFHTEREYRNALARAKGYRSWDAQRQSSAPRVRTARDLARLRPSSREAHQRVGTALTLMHNDPTLSATEAARRAHTTPEAMKRYGGEALIRTMPGAMRSPPGIATCAGCGSSRPMGSSTSTPAITARRRSSPSMRPR